MAKARKSAKRGGAKKGGARRRTTAKRAAAPKRATAKRGAARRRRVGEPITGPRVTSVGGVRALRVPTTGTTRGGATRGFSGAVLNDLKSGDRIVVYRGGHSIVQHSVGGERPRNNPSKRRKRGRKHRVTIHTKHGTRSFMAHAPARPNPGKRRFSPRKHPRDRTGQFTRRR